MAQGIAVAMSILLLHAESLDVMTWWQRIAWIVLAYAIGNWVASCTVLILESEEARNG